MRRTRRYKHSCAVLAAFAVLLPHTALAWQSPPTSPIRDVQLTAGDLLQGQVVDVNGRPLGQVEVTLHREGRVVGRTHTNADGSFAFPGVAAGMSLVSTAGASRVVRAWAPRTAPPAAAEGVLLVSGDVTVRGGSGKGKGKHGSGGWLNGPGLKAAVVLGVAAGIVAIVVDRDSGS